VIGRVVVALVMSLLACSPAADAPEPRERPGPGPLVVYVVNYPLRYFAERIGGEQVQVVFPAPPGVDPAFWSPDGETVARYQSADLVLLNGAGYAGWVQRASLPRASLVDTSAAFGERWISLEGQVIHAHGPTGSHSHNGFAFTTWLDLEQARAQARAIAEAFAASRPAHAQGFRSRLTALESDLEGLDERLVAIAAKLDAAPLLFSHPVYQYLERRYGLNGRSLDWEPDAFPDPAAWRVLEELLESHPAQLMVWEATPLDETAQRLESLGVTGVVFDPCARRPESGDWLSTLNANLTRLETGLGL
jgi:zinc transport system substrate-binding protein